MRQKYNVFVIGLDELNREVLGDLPAAEYCTFHQLLTIEELQHGEEMPFAELLEKAQGQLEEFEGSVDAICGYWDFPVSSMVPILCERFGVPSSSLESRLMCEHKYWSRLVQSRVTDAYPDFQAVDPFADDPLSQMTLAYPFWLKPVKSFSSALAEKVTDDEAFHAAIAEIRDGIGRIGEPFEYVMSMAQIPEDIQQLGGNACIAEEVCTGAQATVEGYRLGDEVVTYGVVDSVEYPDTSSFLRFEYPSQLPDDVQQRMADVSKAVVVEMNLHRTTFNVEFFWEPESGRLAILEVNPRHSQSHAKLFELVDGIANHELMVDLSLGKQPRLKQGAGPYELAAKWFWRRFSDGVVRRRPTEQEVTELEKAVPGTTIEPEVQEGHRLSDLHDQDAYSYKLAHMYIGADSQDELAAKFDRCREDLPFVFEE